MILKIIDNFPLFFKLLKYANYDHVLLVYESLKTNFKKSYSYGIIFHRYPVTCTMSKKKKRKKIKRIYCIYQIVEIY